MPSRARQIGRRAILLGALVLGCAGDPAAPKVAAAERPPPLEFAFIAQDGTRFDSQKTRGRATAILLMTTYDLNSQLVARRIEEMQHSFKPRFNALAIVLEPAKYSVLLEPFKLSLGLTYPVVLADHDTLQGTGPFGPIGEVPILVVLDREGRPLWRVTGPASEQQLRQALRSASAYVEE